MWTKCKLWNKASTIYDKLPVAISHPFFHRFSINLHFTTESPTILHHHNKSVVFMCVNRFRKFLELHAHVSIPLGFFHFNDFILPFFLFVFCYFQRAYFSNSNASRFTGKKSKMR